MLGSDAAILPRIVAIGDVDEDELVFAEAAARRFRRALDVPEALGGLERRLLLATAGHDLGQDVAPGRKGEAPLVANNPAAALALADDLARLMDDMTTRQVPCDQLDALVPREVDNYWQLTLDFLKIARDSVAAHPCRARQDRAGRAARSADQGGSRAAGAQQRAR